MNLLTAVPAIKTLNSALEYQREVERASGKPRQFAEMLEISPTPERRGWCGGCPWARGFVAGAGLQHVRPLTSPLFPSATSGSISSLLVLVPHRLHLPLEHTYLLDHVHLILVLLNLGINLPIQLLTGIRLGNILVLVDKCLLDARR